MREILKAIRDPRLLIVLLMGFSSGLPLLLARSTLKAWLTEEGLDLKTIGFFSLVVLPYAWKFLWSPVMDRYSPLRLGRRRSWLLITQSGLILSLVAISFLSPKTDLALLAIAAFAVAFFSASQDIVIDAYRREILPDEELALGSSLYVTGYRLALLVAGAGALFTADHIPWPQVYLLMAGFMLIGLITTIFSPEPEVDAAPPRTLRESVVGPLREFFRREGAWMILAFVVLYKIGESMASDMFNTFFLKTGFSKTEIAAVAKAFGIWAAIAGGLTGGALVVRLKYYRSLWLFGILQAVGLLLFSVLAQIGTNVTMLGIAVGVENFTSGMATAAFLAFMASQANKRFTATQYALLSSLSGVPGAIFGATTGILAEQLGWTMYFIACALFTIPGLLLLLFMKKLIVQNPSVMEAANG
jgi:PAT family beta-lactamase induction signal transducer AmpG